jgi:hypothetical protein
MLTAMCGRYATFVRGCHRDVIPMLAKDVGNGLGKHPHGFDNDCNRARRLWHQMCPN